MVLGCVGLNVRLCWVVLGCVGLCLGCGGLCCVGFCLGCVGCVGLGCDGVCLGCAGLCWAVLCWFVFGCACIHVIISWGRLHEALAFNKYDIIGRRLCLYICVV